MGPTGKLIFLLPCGHIQSGLPVAAARTSRWRIPSAGGCPAPSRSAAAGSYPPRCLPHERRPLPHAPPRPSTALSPSWRHPPRLLLRRGGLDRGAAPPQRHRIRTAQARHSTAAQHSTAQQHGAQQHSTAGARTAAPKGWAEHNSHTEATAEHRILQEEKLVGSK